MEEPSSNSGTVDLEEVEIGGIAPTTTGPLDPGETVTVYESYIVDLDDFLEYSRYVLPNDSYAEAYYDGQIVSTADSRVTLIGPRV